MGFVLRDGLKRHDPRDPASCNAMRAVVISRRFNSARAISRAASRGGD
jgi:hypothetical protein